MNQKLAMEKLNQAGKLTWWYLDAHFPWRPEVYKDAEGRPNQLFITGDGIGMLRLDVLDLKKFDRFVIKKLQEPVDGWKECIAQPDWIRFVQEVLKLPATESILGKELSLKQLVAVMVRNSKEGTNGVATMEKKQAEILGRKRAKS